MGGSKETVRTETQQTQTPQLHPIEIERLERISGREEFLEPQLRGVQSTGLDLVSQLLAGEALPGGLDLLRTGISPEAIGAQAAEITRQNLPGFQAKGLLDSGVAFRETAKDIANRLLFPSEQFNLQIQQQLLNQALGGQAQVQQPIIGFGQQLGQSLAGARGLTTTGTGTQFTTARQPFAQTFQQLGTGFNQFLSPFSFGSSQAGVGQPTTIFT